MTIVDGFIKWKFDRICQLKPSEQIGSVLRRLRKERGVSQEDLAERSELDRTYISLIENGRRQPTVSTLFAIADALGLKASEIVKQIEEASGESSKD